MGFRGGFPLQGELGAEIQVAQLARTSTGSSNTTVDPPAGKRLRLFSLWLSLSAYIEAAGAAPTHLQVLAEVFDTSFTFGIILDQFGFLAAPAGGREKFHLPSAPVFDIPQGLLLPGGVDDGVTCSLLVSTLDGSTAPANMKATAQYTWLVRSED